ncbi:MAG: hypothetical protein KC713_05525, partial [Candidatus Omnitrophica bacterium]|nr:hypothetical protein [Candidatus Omnitrophota bacterium]
MLVQPDSAVTPALVKGMTIHPEDPFTFDFYILPGDRGADTSQEAFKRASEKLIKYFMTALTVPEKDLWVNLSPYEENRIMPESISKTEMGLNLLAQDYILKQKTATLMRPDHPFGRSFWDRIYKKALVQYGQADIPVDAFNKVWIVPKKAVILVERNNVFIQDAQLKVMLEQDYFALQNNRTMASTDENLEALQNRKDISALSEDIIREIIIPELEYEVNQGAAFSDLRQISNAVILATWYKRNAEKSFLNQMYINQNKTAGIELQDKTFKQQIYHKYVQAFQKGVFDFIQEDYDEQKQEIIQRRYFSGGMIQDWEQLDVSDNFVMSSAVNGTVKVTFGLSQISRSEQRMITPDQHMLNAGDFVKTDSGEFYFVDEIVGDNIFVYAPGISERHQLTRGDVISDNSEVYPQGSGFMWSYWDDSLNDEAFNLDSMRAMFEMALEINFARRDDTQSIKYYLTDGQNRLVSRFFQSVKRNIERLNGENVDNRAISNHEKFPLAVYQWLIRKGLQRTPNGGRWINVLGITLSRGNERKNKFINTQALDNVSDLNSAMRRVVGYSLKLLTFNR